MDLIFGKTFHDKNSKDYVVVGDSEFYGHPLYFYYNERGFKYNFAYDNRVKDFFVTNSYGMNNNKKITKKYHFIPNTRWRFIMFSRSVIFFPAFREVELYVDNFYKYFSRKLVKKVGRKEVNDKIAVIYMSFNRHRLKYNTRNMPNEMIEMILSFIKLIDLYKNKPYF